MRKLMQYISSLLCTPFRQHYGIFLINAFVLVKEAQTDVAPSWYTSVAPCRKPAPFTVMHF